MSRSLPSFPGASTLAVLAGALLGAFPVVAQTPSHDSTKGDSAFLSVELPLKQGSTPAFQLAAAVRTAHQMGRTPVVEIGAPWCGPCHSLMNLLQSSKMHGTMQHMYVIALDNDQWKQSLLQLGYDAGTGIPRMVVIDSTGHPVGEPWRPRDVPDSLTRKLGVDGAWQVTLTSLFAKARQQ